MTALDSRPPVSEHLPNRRFEIAKPVRLDPVRQNSKQQVSWHVSQRLTPEYAPPASPQAFEVESAQLRDLVLWLDQ